jgi:hypothetical protein
LWRASGDGRSAGQREHFGFAELDSDGTTRTCHSVDENDDGTGPSQVLTRPFGGPSTAGPSLAAPGCRSMLRSPAGTSYYSHISTLGDGSSVHTLRRALPDTTPDPAWVGEPFDSAPVMYDRSVAEVGNRVYVVGSEWTGAGGVPLGTVVARYLSNGSLDDAFGNGGVVRLGPGRDALTGLVRTSAGFVADEDGVVIALNATPEVDATRHPSSSIIARLRASDGALDPSFAGGRGWVASSKPILDILAGPGDTVVTLSGGFRRSPTSRTYDYLPLTIARRNA